MVDIVCILDRSGSMRGLANEVIGSFNEFLKEQKKMEGEARLTLVLFDDHYDVVYDKVELNSVPDLTSDLYFARGMTALHDAIGKTITSMKEVTKAIVLIQTDGEENSSHEYKKDAIKKLVEEKTIAGWEFHFIGANIDAMAEGTSYGIHNNTQITNDLIGIQKAAVSRMASVTKYRGQYPDMGQ